MKPEGEFVMRSVDSLIDEIQHRSGLMQLFKVLGIVNFVVSVLAGIKYESLIIFLAGLCTSILFFAAWGSEAAIKQRLETEIKERGE